MEDGRQEQETQNQGRAKPEIWDMIIIGGGPTGVGAGVYAAGQKLKTLVIAAEFGGQSIVSSTIRNWIGVKPSINRITSVQLTGY